MTTQPAGQLFLVECYLPGAAADEIAAALSSVMAADRGTAAFVCCLAIPGDDTYFCLFSGGTPDRLELTFHRAGVPFERIVEAREVGVDAAGAAFALQGE
ncbi:hypothetical protein SAMN05216553_101594 [Lentzea fradiae]|uniref:DUF4242 domain-containing protein n=1 Tax=Lentzea fradiae TaxID=200378 RepID=A0A1G7L0K5_9PSEU|nr:hypothetical protein [Lentzea fradiae]SDF42854.1 hypothetical protein SAMN05216553_101594 [Lentzea fradiae]